jgi:NAD(P)-dependent dehydrogenase (short-subunit alcohol dehydrogenase family)
MKVLVIGATGTIGKAVADAFQGAGHEVLRASRNGDHKVDISDPGSIKALFEGAGKVDAVVSCAGNTAFKPTTELTEDDLQLSINDKLLGNINLLRFGVGHVNDGGQFILTTGIFSQHPMPGVPAVALVNGALESFARAAALDMPRGIRVNAVSPPFIKETAEKMGMPGGYPAADNAKAYIELATGSETGKVVFPGS